MANENYYIDNNELKKEIIKWKRSYNKQVKELVADGVEKDVAKKNANGELSEELGEMFLKIAYGIGNKRCFINYTYKDEMIGLGLQFLCKYAKSFNPKKSNNAFSYCSQICRNGFIQCINKEKKVSVMKDKLIKNSMETSELDKFIKERSED